MLKLENISFEVHTEETHKEILKNINLEIEDGFVAITGPNGGGKSTLAKIIAGIYQPTSGRIYFDGVDITDMSITEIAMKCGYETSNYFGDAFRRINNCSPSQFRRMNGNVQKK